MIEQFVQTWGYAAVFAGTFLEGESVLIAAGFAAHRGMLDLAIVVAVAACVRVLLRRRQLPFILSVRFLYGLRVAGPIAIGMARIPWVRFLALNALGAVVWAILIGGAGYFFGAALEVILADLRRHEGWIFGAILAMGAGTALVLAARRSNHLK